MQSFRIYMGSGYNDEIDLTAEQALLSLRARALAARASHFRGLAAAEIRGIRLKGLVMREASHRRGWCAQHPGCAGAAAQGGAAEI